jgi:hypothetical protein
MRPRTWPATLRDNPLIFGLCDDLGEPRRTNGVDCAGKFLGLQRLGSLARLLAREAVGCAQGAEVVVLLGPARDWSELVAEVSESRDRHTGRWRPDMRSIWSVVEVAVGEKIQRDHPPRGLPWRRAVRRPIRRPSRAEVASHEQGRQGPDPDDTQRAGQFQSFINAYLHLLGAWFNDEFSTWSLDELAPINSDAYDTAYNWKLEFASGSSTTQPPSSSRRSAEDLTPLLHTSLLRCSVDTLSQSRGLVHILATAETHSSIRARSDRLAAAPDKHGNKVP